MDRLYPNHQVLQPQLPEVVLNNYSWLQLLDSSPFELYSSAHIKQILRPELILSGEVYERAADGWLSASGESFIFGYNQSQIRDKPLADRMRLKACISANDYHFNLCGINDYEITLKLEINRDEVQSLKDEHKPLKRGLVIKFIQLGIMLASLINPDYLPLLTSTISDPNLEVILPQWRMVILPQWRIEALSRML